MKANHGKGTEFPLLSVSPLLHFQQIHSFCPQARPSPPIPQTDLSFKPLAKSSSVIKEMNVMASTSGFIRAKVIGRGSFCEVFEAINPATSEAVAIKYPRRKESAKLLSSEASTMRHLANCHSTSHTGIPKLIDDAHCPEFIVMEKVGKTLLRLNTELKQLSLKTIVMVAIKAITALEEIHLCGVVHRDVKPDNIAIPLSPSDPRILFIDLGLSCKYVVGGAHVTYSEKTKFQGTPFFCSLNALKNVKPSRRDDLEALGFVLVYLCGRELPWFECDPSRPTFFEDIIRIRERTPLSVLCKGLEPEFAEYLSYCQHLGFSEKPNYSSLCSNFTRLAQRFGFTLDWKYDWTKSAKKQSSRMRKSLSIGDSMDAQGKSTRSRGSSKTRPSTESSVNDLKSSIPKKAEKPLNPLAIDFDLESSDENIVDERETPVHRVDQLPAFHRARVACAELQETEVTETHSIALPPGFRP